jgi:hypothetical protein
VQCSGIYSIISLTSIPCSILTYKLLPSHSTCSEAYLGCNFDLVSAAPLLQPLANDDLTVPTPFRVHWNRVRLCCVNEVTSLLCMPLEFSACFCPCTDQKVDVNLQKVDVNVQANDHNMAQSTGGMLAIQATKPWQENPTQTVQHSVNLQLSPGTVKGSTGPVFMRRLQVCLRVNSNSENNQFNYVLPISACSLLWLLPSA